MALTQIDGVLSGLKTGEIIEQLMAVERRPLELLQAKSTAEASRLKAIQSLKAQVVAFQGAVAGLLRRGALNAKSAASDSPAALTATATADALNGSFRVTVSQLATATKVGSGGPIGADITSGNTLATAGLRLTPVYGTLTINDQTIEVLNTDTVDSLIARIDALPDVAARLIDNADGRTIVKLESAAPPRLGALGDTSNALRLLNLADANATLSGGTYEVRSTLSLGAADVGAALADSRLATPITGLDAGGNGAFAINGTQISYKATDSIGTIVNRVNTSNAGVIAFYDPVQDRLRLTAGQTGARSITLSDTTGNFLAATGLVGGTQALGQNAVYTVDTVNGGQPLSSSSNAVSGVVLGVTLELKAATASPATVTVSQDTAASIRPIKEAVDKLNALLDSIRTQTKYNPDTREGSILTGESAVLDVERVLRSLTNAAAVGVSGRYRSLADLGISTGVVGSAVGSTTRLVVDETKLAAALNANPQAVSAVIAGFQAALGAPSGAGNVAAISGTPLKQHEAGTYYVKVLDAGGTAEARFVTADGRELYKASGTLVAGAEDSSLIPGLKIRAAAALAVGEDAVALTVDARGVAVRVDDYLGTLLGPAGFFTTREDSSDAIASQLADRIAEMEDRLKGKEASLTRRFTTLERTLAQLQSQSNAVLAQLARFNTSS